MVDSIDNCINQFKAELDLEENDDSPFFSEWFCEECEKDTLQETLSGTFECKICGFIKDNPIDHTAEWRYYGADDNKLSDPTRCGMPINPLLPNSSLGTVISLQHGSSQRYRRLCKFQSWNSIAYGERSLYKVFDEISVKASGHGIVDDIIKCAQVYYKLLSEKQISRGKNRQGIIAACIFMACKNKNVPRSAKEIANIFKIPVDVLTKGCKRFQDIWIILDDSQMEIQNNASQPEDFVERFCSELNSSRKLLNLSVRITKNAQSLKIISENTPPSIAAGSIYMAASILGISISKSKIADISLTSEVTITKSYKKLLKYKDKLTKEMQE